MFRRLRHARSPEDRLAVRNELVLANLGLALTIARWYRGRGLPFEDLVSEGVFGLIAAVDRFDPALGWRFSAYASSVVRWAIRRALDQTDERYPFRLPTHVHTAVGLVQQAERALEARGRPGADPGALVAALRARPAHAAKLIPRGRVPLLQELAHPDRAAWHEAALLPDEGVHAPLDERLTLAGPNQEALLEAREHLRELAGLLEHVLGFVRALAGGAEAIVLHRFGLHGRDPLTLEEIGELLGVSAQRVQAIEVEAFRRLERRCTGITPAMLVELERRLRELGAVLLTGPATGDAGCPGAPASGGEPGVWEDPPAQREPGWSERPGWGYRLAPAGPRKRYPMPSWAMRELIASVLGDVPAAPRRTIRSHRASGDPAAQGRRAAARSPAEGAASGGPLGDELLQVVVLPRATLAELQREAVRLDRNLSSLIQLAWRLAGPALRKVASPNDFVPPSVATVRPAPLG